MCPPLAASAHCRLDFRPGERGVGVRRGIDFVRLALAQWRPGTNPAVVHDVLLVAAELLANAVDHAGGPVALDLWLAASGDRLRIDVVDTGPAAPRILPVRPGEPHHRGLRIVDHIAEAWGHRRDDTGKTVWAELRLP
ncbi:ATP-binding protein [Streptomyces sp. NRRL B-24484]|uniref:ATP-binding protein n=1 Tax=Streptomyces sp. NRRL B-24484 TaxID=1463833 RepID=UPI000694CEF7|nr:ATP-binding protein [Streptomyces sp. NRRL B-24484]